MGYLRKIEKTIMDKMRNTNYRENMKLKPITTILDEGQLRWFGYVSQINEEILTRKLDETRAKK